MLNGKGNIWYESTKFFLLTTGHMTANLFKSCVVPVLSQIGTNLAVAGTGVEEQLQKIVSWDITLSFKWKQQIGCLKVGPLSPFLPVWTLQSR